MLATVYLTLLVVGLSASKLAIVDRQTEVLASGTAMIIFAALTFASFGIQPTFAPGTTVTTETMAWLCMGAAAVNFVVFLLAGLEQLPDPTEESNNAN